MASQIWADSIKYMQGIICQIIGYTFQVFWLKIHELTTFSTDHTDFQERIFALIVRRTIGNVSI